MSDKYKEELRQQVSNIQFFISEFSGWYDINSVDWAVKLPT